MNSLRGARPFLAAGALVVAACRHAARDAGAGVWLARRPVLFALARALGEARPAGVARGLAGSATGPSSAAGGVPALLAQADQALYFAKERGRNRVEVASLDLVRQPWAFDVMVMENLLGDLLSDLAAGLIGGLGMVPCAELGRDHGLFQPAHGSAPDIAGRDLANPLAMFLSAALMLDWLGERHGATAAAEAARRLRTAIEHGLADGTIRPLDQGGDQGTRAVARAVIGLL